MKYDKELRCLNTKGKYGKVTNTEIKWSIISKSVMIIIFVELINQSIIRLIMPALLVSTVSSLSTWTDRPKLTV